MQLNGSFLPSNNCVKCASVFADYYNNGYNGVPPSVEPILSKQRPSEYGFQYISDQGSDFHQIVSKTREYPDRMLAIGKLKTDGSGESWLLGGNHVFNIIYVEKDNIVSIHDTTRGKKLSVAFEHAAEFLKTYVGEHYQALLLNPPSSNGPNSQLDVEEGWVLVQTPSFESQVR